MAETRDQGGTGAPPDDAPKPENLVVLQGGKRPRKRLTRMQERERRRQKELDGIKERYGLGELDALDKAILTLRLQHPTMSVREIARVLSTETNKIGYDAVWRRTKREAFRRAEEYARADALAVITKNQSKAARVLGQLLDSKEERVQLRAALAHLWPILRAEAEGPGAGAGEFVKFIEDAYQEATDKKGKAAAKASSAPAAAGR